MPAPCPNSIDRIAPTRDPGGRIAMYQRWAKLLFLHWSVPVEMLRALVPPELEIDTFEGNAYVGLVPFTMTDIRPRGLPAIRQLSDFHETNVRTYVHFRGRDPGVWFFSLDAANAAAVRIARAWYKLPYHFAAMRLHERPHRWAEDVTITEYETTRLWPHPLPAGCNVRYEIFGDVSAAAPGTLEHFLAERYILYAKSGGRLYQGRVHHEPYPLQGAEVQLREETMLAAAGIARPDTEPLAHYAAQVRVKVYALTPAG